MYVVAMRVLHHPQDAEDACLTSWEKVIKNLDKIDKIDCQKTKSFLVIIVERTAIDLYRKNQKKNQIIGIVVALVAAFLFTTLSSYIVDSMTTKEISYNQFIALLENNNVESVVFNNNKIEITPKDNNGNIIKVKYWTTELNDPELIQELKEKYTQVKFKGEQQSSSSSLLLILLEWVLPFVMFYVLLTFIMKKAGGGAGGVMFGVGKSNAKV